MKTALLEQARKQLAGGDTEDCLNTLKQVCTQPDMPKAYQDQHTLISGAYADYRRRTINGTLAGTEASVELARIHERILQLMQDISLGNPPAQEPQKKGTQSWFIWLGLALVGIAAIWFLRQKSDTCPTYQAETHWKIGLVPFTNLGDRAAKPEQIIARSINELTQKNGLSAQALVWPATRVERGAQAQSLLANCSADLLISGEYVVLSTDSIEISLTYQFNDNRPPVQTEFAGFSNVTALRDGILEQRSVDDAIFSLCTLLAMRENKPELAAKWIKKIQQPKHWEQDMRDAMQK